MAETKPKVKKAPAAKPVAEKQIKAEKAVVKSAKPAVKAVKVADLKYIAAMGKRKSAAASVRLMKNGSGKITVNDMPAEKYFTSAQYNTLIAPLKLTEEASFDVSVKVTGGGKVGQADAVRHGISKALMEINPEWRPVLKAKGYITRDARIKERKKPGLKKARRAPQWSKR